MKLGQTALALEENVCLCVCTVKGKKVELSLAPPIGNSRKPPLSTLK